VPKLLLNQAVTPEKLLCNYW